MRMRALGMTYAQIADRIDVCPQRVWQLVNHKIERALGDIRPHVRERELMKIREPWA